jgi:hypothetical protein
MSVDPRDNAFPIFSAQGCSDPDLRGLTKREYFAALAMQGILATESEDYNYGHNSAPRIAARAVEQADALIAALNGEGQANG